MLRRGPVQFKVASPSPIRSDLMRSTVSGSALDSKSCGSSGRHPSGASVWIRSDQGQSGASGLPKVINHAGIVIDGIASNVAVCNNTFYERRR